MPIVATIAGIIFLSEKLNWYEPIGIILALFGIAITQGLLKSRNSTKAAQ
jgi:drug/metabolite transporter (DMT)-like permease